VRKLGMVVLFVVGSLLSAAAQQSGGKAEVFGGYQYARPDGGPNLNGWNFAATGNFNKNFGITGDLSGTYGGGGSMYTFMVGPKLTANLPAVKPFVHVLFGGVRLGPSGFTTTAFGTMLGGGFDVGHGHLAWRAVQADWLILRSGGFTDKTNARVSTGLVVRF